MGPTTDTPGASTPNDWERWRGRVDAKLGDLCADLRRFESSCDNCRSAQSHGIGEIHRRITSLEVKVARMAGGWALVGSAVGAALAVLAQHLIGG